MTWHDSTQCGCPKVSYSACLQVIDDGCDPIVMDLRAAKRGGANNEILQGRRRNFLICRQLIAPELPSVYNSVLIRRWHPICSLLQILARSRPNF